MTARFRKFHALVALLAFAGWADAAEPVTLVAGPDPIAIGRHMEILRDEAGTLTIDDVRRETLSAQFQDGNADSYNFGYVTGAYWYRVTLRSPVPATATGDWVFELTYALLDEVELFITRGDGTTEAMLSGDVRPPPPRQLEHHYFAFPLELRPGEQVTLHFRIETEGLQAFPPRLWTAPAFHAHASRERFGDGAYFGIMVVMMAYNLIIFVAIRDRSYFFYVLWLVALTITSLAFYGYARQYLNPLVEQPRLISTAAALGWPLSSIAGNWFWRSFLQSSQTMPRAHLLSTALLWAGAAVAAMVPLVPYDIAIRAGLVHAAVNAITGLGAAAYLAIHGSRAARFYLFAWSGLGVGAFLAILAIFGWTPPFFAMTKLVVQAGSIFGVAVLSLALADRINVERREREKLGRLKNFFAPEVAEAVLTEGEKQLLAPVRRDITVLFTDLRGFTEFSTQSPPEEVMRALREYRETIVDAAAKHGGTLEHFAGDGVMIYFNAPVQVADPELRAVRLALDLRQRFTALCAGWRKRGHELGVGIGMASGYATVGAVGFQRRMDYSVVGSVTNLAARLCAQAGHGQILMSQQLLGKVENLVSTDSLGERELKGLPKPVAVYNLAGLAST